MTVLGGALYAGFFGVAALWLAVTAPERADTHTDIGAETERPRQPVGSAH